MNPEVSITLDDVLQFKLRADDVLVSSYPKSGTTWTQEIVWLICNNADFKTAKKYPVIERSPLLSHSGKPTNLFKGLEPLKKWPESQQRIMKTHLYFEELPLGFQTGRKCKLIYIARNPKDVSVSYYHFIRAMPEKQVCRPWAEYLERFSDGREYGSWFSHVIPYFKEHQGDKDHIHFVTYEMMKKDLRSVIRNLAKFLGKDVTEGQVDEICEHCTFESMKDNKMVNWSQVKVHGYDQRVSPFMRKGEVGDWKNYFTVNQSIAFDKLYEEKIRGCQLKLEFEP